MDRRIKFDNKRIAFNTIMLYIRMLLIMLVQIYTSRVVLDVLGVVDYGIYNVVGGIVVFMSFLNASMSNAVQRFLSFELGRNNTEKANHVFCMSLVTHFFIAVIVFVIIESAGPWFLKTYMTIPHERLYAAQWVLQCSVVSTIFSFFQVPYNAIIIAKEKMAIYAYVGIVEVVFRLIIVYVLLITGKDKLVFYAMLQMLVTIVILQVYRIYCTRNFVETRFRLIKDYKILYSVGSFAIWNLIGEFSWVMTNQGVGIIINIFCGPIVNAARGIADQVNTAVLRFVNNFQMAINPQIIKNFSIGQQGQMELLVGRGTRLSYFLMLFLSLPLITEMDFILNLWLVQVPDYAVGFCRLVLVYSLVTIITNLLVQVIRATGDIRLYQIITALCNLLNFPLTYIFLKLGYSPIYSIYIAIIIQFFIGLLRLYFVHKMTNYDIKLFLHRDFGRIVMVTLLAVPLPFCFILYLESSMLRFIYVCIVNIVMSIIITYKLGLTDVEQKKTVQFVQTKIKCII